MKELTKEQKLHAYTYAYLNICAGVNPFGDCYLNCVCDSLKDFINTLDTIDYWYDRAVLYYFPEFTKQKPETADLWWWPNTPSGNRSRLLAIERAIDLIEKQKP